MGLKMCQFSLIYNSSEIKKGTTWKSVIKDFKNLNGMNNFFTKLLSK